MDSNVNYTIVGAFMVTLISVTVLAIIWLSSGFSIAQYRTYAVYTRDSVSGLNVDSPVEYNGVNVGNVTQITLDEHNPQIVRLLLGINTNTPITNSTVATLTTRGITGITFIMLKDSGTDSVILKALPGQAYPVIKSGPSLLTRIDTALTALSTNLQEVTLAIRSLLDKDNQKAIKNILLNLDDVTRVLADNSGKLNLIITNTNKATQQLTPLMQSSIGAIKAFQTQTLPVTYQLLGNLDNITRTLNQITNEIQQNPSVLIRGVNRTNYGPGEK